MDNIKKIETLYELKKYDEVIKNCIENLYKRDSDKESLFYYLIISLINTHEDEKALEFCLNAKEEFPTNSTFIYLHSKISLQFKNIDQARELIKTALKIEPNNPLYYYHHCRIFIEEKNFVDAKKMIDTALEIDSTDLDYHLANALILYMLDGEKVAREIVEEVLSKDPHHEYALYLKQGLFTSKLKDKKSILNGLLLRNPFDLDYQKDIKFIKFYYRYIPVLMALTIGLSFLLHSDRGAFGFLESWSFLLFLVVGLIGSHDWRFNIPFVGIMLSINAYFTNIPDGIELLDVGIILFLAPLYSWVLNTMFFVVKSFFLRFKEKQETSKNAISYYLFTYPFEKNGKIDTKELYIYYVSTTLLVLGSLYIFYLYPTLKEDYEYLKVTFVGVFFLVTIYSSKNFLMSVLYVFLTLLIIKTSNMDNAGITLLTAFFITPLFLGIRNLISRIKVKNE